MSRVESVVLTRARWIAPFAAVMVLWGAVSAVAKSATVTTQKTKLGKVLAASNGQSLYMFNADRPDKSNCTGSCVNTWLPLLSSGRPVAAAGSGVNAKLLGTIKRTNHTLQVTYNGHPLYLFAKDSKPGQINGESVKQFGGHWYVVNTAGKEVKPKSSGLPQGY